MNTRQRIESVVKNTTDNRGEEKKNGQEDGRKVFPYLNPEGKNQSNYKSLRDAIRIYCEFHPDKVEQCVESIVTAAIAGDSKMARLLGDFFGGPDKQQLEVSGSVETKQQVSVLDSLTDEELDYLIKLKEAESAS